jgi:hypothetical protein
MRRIVSCCALLAVLAAAGCTSHRAPGEAGLTLTGRVQLESGGRKTTVSSPLTIHRGQTVRVTRGTAALAFSDDRRLELRQGSAVKVERTPTVVAGDALMIAEGTKFTVRAAGSTVSVRDGAARLNRRLGVEAAAYTNSVEMVSAGRRLVVPTLRQATIASLGIVPARAEPLRLRPTDAWDRRYLGDAIELNEQLQMRSDGFTGQLAAGTGRSVAFFTSLLPDLGEQKGFEAALVDARRAPGETLVGATIALTGRQSSFAERWREVFSFRDEGAAWGLVAVDQHVGAPSGLTSAIDAALGRSRAAPVELAAPAAPEPTSETTPPLAAPASPPPTPTPSPSPGGTTSPTQPAPEEPPPAPSPLQPVVDTLGDLVGGLLSGLGGGQG